ncbi:MAG: CPBP family intramembrane metalloprotease [Lewinella sp.]|nr:CPBP family intramembrane metalloprotease [Lewinella sp.]
MTAPSGPRAIILTLLGFAVYLWLRPYFGEVKSWLDGLTGIGLLSYMLTYLLFGLPLFVATGLINRDGRIFRHLGLVAPVGPALGWALVFALPMLLGGALFFPLAQELSAANLIAGSLVIGWVEEVFFRGFLFGQLYRHTRLGFLPAIFVGAVVFATGHLYQSQETGELLGIFAVTFMGAVLFAWLYVEWDDNLWVPIFLHALMNLAWHLFDMDTTALGGALPNLLRGLTIALAILLTIRHRRRRGQPMAITRRGLWWKEGETGGAG